MRDSHWFAGARGKRIRSKIRRLSAGAAISWTAMLVCVSQSSKAQPVVHPLQLPSELRIVNSDRDTIRSTGLNDRIKLTIDGLARARTDSVTPLDVRRLVLFLDGRPVPGIVGSAVGSDARTVEFELKRLETQPNRDAWAALVGAPKGRARNVSVGAGTIDGGEIPWIDGQTHLVSLRTFSGTRLVIITLSLLITLATIGAYAVRNGMLREADPMALTGASSGAAFSLSRLQSAIWFTVIFSSFVFLYLTTFDFSTSLSPQALLLMGISALSGALSSEIANRKVQIGTQRIRELRAEPLPFGVAARSATQLAEGMLGKGSSRSLLLDLLSDKNGPTVYRLQLLMWTVTLALIFLFQVYQNLAMPEFSATLLALLGLSNGTYLGFKVPELQSGTEHSTVGIDRPQELVALPGIDPSPHRMLLSNPDLGMTIEHKRARDRAREQFVEPPTVSTSLTRKENARVTDFREPDLKSGGSEDVVAQPSEESLSVYSINAVASAFAEDSENVDEVMRAKKRIESFLIAESGSRKFDGPKAWGADSLSSNLVGVGLSVGVGTDNAEISSRAAAANYVTLLLYVVQPMTQADARVLAKQVTQLSDRVLDRMPISVQRTGIIEALPGHRFRSWPAPGGISVGHFRGSTGTLGCLARGRSEDRRDRLFILSNNHVIADSNGGVSGDCVCQPGPIDGGACPADQIASLERQVTIDFTAPNFVDAAVGWALPSQVRPELVLVDAGVPKFFRISNRVGKATQGMRVGKSGRTTAVTQGVVREVSATIQVQYPLGRIATFQDQIAIEGTDGKFSDRGDSGSVIWTDDDSRTPVGLLFAGSDTRTFANHMHHVCDALDIELFT